MKTSSKVKTQSAELKSRPEQFTTSTEQQSAVAAPERPPLPKIHFARRRANRVLPTQQLLAVLQRDFPRFFELAEVIGKWVWIQFQDKQPSQITAQLAQLGFHWNNRRQAWQHPCGSVTPGTDHDPREKYPHYFPADMKQAA